MRSKTRSVLVSAFALIACLVAASSAAALTVSPTGAYTAASGTTRLGLSSNGQALTCASSSIGANINADGTGTIPRGSATYTSCRNSLLGSFTVTQAADWTLTTTLTASSVNLVVNVPTNGVTLSGLGCTFSLGGTATLSAPITGLPATISSANVAASTLRITSNNGGALCFNFPVGLAATYGAAYTLNRAATVSG